MKYISLSGYWLFNNIGLCYMILIPLNRTWSLFYASSEISGKLRRMDIPTPPTSCSLLLKKQYTTSWGLQGRCPGNGLQRRAAFAYVWEWCPTPCFVNSIQMEKKEMRNRISLRKTFQVLSWVMFTSWAANIREEFGDLVSLSQTVHNLAIGKTNKQTNHSEFHGTFFFNSYIPHSTVALWESVKVSTTLK